MSIPNGKMKQKSNGDKYWYMKGKFHRTDGPAVIGAKGYKIWYINGIWIGAGDAPPPGFYEAVVAYKKTLNSDDLTVDDLGDLL